MRQDLQHTGLAGHAIEAVDAWLVCDWPQDALPFDHAGAGPRGAAEQAGAALERAGLRGLDMTLPGERLLYLWFATPVLQMK